MTKHNEEGAIQYCFHSSDEGFCLRLYLLVQLELCLLLDVAVHLAARGHCDVLAAWNKWYGLDMAGAVIEVLGEEEFKVAWIAIVVFQL